MSMNRYVAFLRGINVGGHKKIKMADLRAMLVGLGYGNVKTVLASGNVAFDAEAAAIGHVCEAIEQAIESTFGFAVPVIVLRLDQLQQQIDLNPFDGIAVSKGIHRYVTFLATPTQPSFDIPYTVPTQDYTILQVSDIAVYSVLTLSAQTKTVDAMKLLEDAFGKSITTRKWDTLLKLMTSS